MFSCAYIGFICIIVATNKRILSVPNFSHGIFIHTRRINSNLALVTYKFYRV